MSKDSVISSKVTDVSEFTAMLEKIGQTYATRTIPIPDELSRHGLYYPNDLYFLYQDVKLQSYKYYNVYPGQLVKLSSMITPPLGMAVYATRNAEGNLQLIVKTGSEPNEHYYEFHTTQLKEWQPHQALLNRLHHLNTQIPTHFQPYLSGDSNELIEFIEGNQDKLGQLKNNQTIVLEHKGTRFHIVKTLNGEFKALIETKDPSKPFIQIDVPEKNVYKPYQGQLLEPFAIKFIADLQEAQKNLLQKGLPRELNGLIIADDLNLIYKYLLENPGVIPSLANGESFRIPKEISGTARTVNIVKSETGEFMLFLETKRKLASGKKDSARVIGSGSFGTVKPAWRIDTTVPEEWVNKVMKGEHAQEADYEALFSQNVVHNVGEDRKTLNVTLLGELFTSKGVVKRSQYSKRAVGDLKKVLDNPNIFLTNEDKKRIRANILDGLKVMHDKGLIHQDLKLPNIFIYRDLNGDYYAKVADFGISYNPNLPLAKPALASGGYESPEIVYANESPLAEYHQYYHQSQFIINNSLAYRIHQQKKGRDPNSPEAISYRKPDPANDMWALGILLFELEHKHMPKLGYSKDEELINSDPLLKGLLQTNRTDRININQAIQIQHEQVVIPKPLLESERVRAVSFQSSIMTTSSVNKPVDSEPFDYKKHEEIYDIDYLELGALQGLEGRTKRDSYILALNSIQSDNPILFSLFLESQTVKSLERLNQSLKRYDNGNAYPHLIKNVEQAISNKLQILKPYNDMADKELANQGKIKLGAFLPPEQRSTLKHS